VLMLVHIGQPEAAGRVHNAWLRTIEDGIHTYDVFEQGVSTEKVGTREFADAVIARIGQKPNRLKPAAYSKAAAAAPMTLSTQKPVKMETRGIDVFVYWPSRNADELAAAIGKHAGDGLTLQMIDNRGVKVWPAGRAETFCTDSFRCRFMAEGRTGMRHLIALLQRISEAGLDISMTETLRSFDGQQGFTLAQGQ
jgi:isocitrate dehydrogenase